MTLEEKKRKKEEIIATTDMKSILIKYGVEVKRNVCKCMFHQDKHPSMKVFQDAVHCFVCGKQWNVFDVVMQLNYCDFNTAFDLLGGNEVETWATTVRKNKLVRERRQREFERQMAQLRLKQQYLIYHAIKGLINQYEPFSDEWCYYQNRMNYQLYLLEEYERAADG